VRHVEGWSKICSEDYVGLWSIVHDVKIQCGDGPDLQENTLSIIRKLLTENEVVAGRFHNHDFVRWHDPVDEVLQKIATAWQQIGRDPTIGEIAWFTSKDQI
jgi:hypothetical protein